MGKAPCCSKIGLRRGPWSLQEDKLLTDYIGANGEGNWRSLPNKAGLLRCGKSCRLRWKNYLCPGIKRGNITPDEEDLILRLHSLVGNRWSLIAGRLPDRTDNEIKNYFNTHLFKRLTHAALRSGPAAVKMTKSHRNKNYNPTATIDDDSNNVQAAAATANEVKVFVPKPIRFRPRSHIHTSNHNSCLSSSTTSSPSREQVVNKKQEELAFLSDGEANTNKAEESNFAWPWPPSIELADANNINDSSFFNFSLHEFLDESLPQQHLGPMFNDMLEKVYDEYLQQL